LTATASIGRVPYDEDLAERIRNYYRRA